MPPPRVPCLRGAVLKPKALAGEAVSCGLALERRGSLLAWCSVQYRCDLRVKFIAVHKTGGDVQPSLQRLLLNSGIPSLPSTSHVAARFSLVTSAFDMDPKTLDPTGLY